MNAWNKLSVAVTLASAFGLAACGDSLAFLWSDRKPDPQEQAAKEEREKRTIAEYVIGARSFEGNNSAAGAYIHEIVPRSMPNKVCVIAQAISVSCFEKSAAIDGNAGNTGKAGKLDAAYSLNDRKEKVVFEFTPVGNPEYRCVLSLRYRWGYSDVDVAALSCLKP